MSVCTDTMQFNSGNDVTSKLHGGGIPLTCKHYIFINRVQ